MWLPSAHPPAPGNLASNGSPVCAAASASAVLTMPTSSSFTGGPAPASPAPTSVGGPVPTDARQGRHKQRYNEAGERLVAG